MTTYSLTSFLAGAIFAGYCLIGLFFCRFWAKTKDRLFGWFAASFWLLAAERIMMLRAGIAGSNHSMIYLTRLCAFLLIVAAIIAKNRALKKQ